MLFNQLYQHSKIKNKLIKNPALALTLESNILSPSTTFSFLSTPDDLLEILSYLSYAYS